MRALAPLLADERNVMLAPVLGLVALGIGSGLLWLWLLGRAAALPLWGWIVLGLAMRLLWLDAPVVLNTDPLRYLWDGALVAHGIWPWGPPPAAGVPPALGEAGAALAAELSFAHLRSIYPGTAQAGFALAHLLAPYDVLGLRLVMLAAEAVALLLGILLRRRLGWPQARAGLWWCCPLLPLLLTGNAHVDALLPPLLLGALLATLAGRGGAAGVLLGLAAGVKLWPVLLAPLLGRFLPASARLPALLGLALAGGATVLPLLVTALMPDAGLGAYAGRWWINNAPYAWAQLLLPEALLRPALGLAAGLVALWVAWRAPATPAGLVGGALAVAAAVFYLSPAQFPWYAIWFMPFAALLCFRPLLLPAALLPLYWLWFPLAAAGQGALFQYGVAVLHALPVALALAWWRWRR